ncbi:MAG: class I SAM-dependent methyltransferase [Desulfovibrionaceae bacterium]
MLPQKIIDELIETSTFRRNVYNMVPENSTRVLDFGCGNGSLLLRLQRDKNCTELYGIELDAAESKYVELAIEKVWRINIEHDLGELNNYKGYFNYIILHDAIEHLYDPWFTLTKIRALLTEDGKIIIATPNIHHWRLQYQIHKGLFPYGPGLWHTGHLRWYTPISLLELLILGGLSINDIFLEIPDKVDFKYLASKNELKTIQIPPLEFAGQKGYEEYKDIITVTYEKDIKRYYPVFYAHKIIAHCGKGDLLFEPTPMTYNCPMLESLRKAINLPFDIYNPPAMRPLIGNWS